MSDDPKKALAKLSHNLRTPLSVMHTTTAMLLNPKYQFTAEQMRDQLERLRRNVDLLNRMAGQLSDILNLTGTASANPESLDVNESLRATIAGLEAAARDKGIELVSEVGADAWTVRADRLQLALLFQHLVAGAVERGKKGDRVTVRSTPERSVTIQESGAGISDAESADPGLFIGRQIASALGGTLRISPQTGTGSTITLTLPPTN